jgi:hypothetical protein
LLFIVGHFYLLAAFVETVAEAEVDAL